MHLLKYNWSNLSRNAWNNRQELIAAGQTTRRDLLKLGLLTGSGLLIAKEGLSSRTAHAGGIASPVTRSFVQPLPISPIKRPLANGINSLFPLPTIEPNNAGGEGRTRAHQAFVNYPDKFQLTSPALKVFEIKQKESWSRMSPDLPLQRGWGFDGLVPGPTYYAKYGEQMLVRNRNMLPADNGGFGIQRVSTHLHNAHNPSESDGFPYDFFPNPQNPLTANATFYDHHYPNVLAGFSSTHAPDGDIRESLGTLWYHDHSAGYTAQNTYKGLSGMYILYNHLDNGNENDPTGYRLPGVRSTTDFYANVSYDIPLMLCDRVFNPSTGQLYFDLFERDGILGDKFLVNGAIQPYLMTKPRRYRFRLADGGPSRFYQLFLTDKGSNTAIPFWIISNDGNLLPKPIKVTSVPLSVAERRDIVIDFKPWAGKTLYLENRLVQSNGRGPDENLGSALSLKAPGTGDFIMQFKVETAAVADNSINFETTPNVRFYDLPEVSTTPVVTRNFRFGRFNSMWTVNEKLFPDDENTVNFRVRKNSAEVWTLQNNSGGWMHPVHTHVEEFQLVKRNGVPVVAGSIDQARKDVMWLGHGELHTLAFRFRDFTGRYPMHCHNPIPEDHAMMLRFDIDDSGDTNSEP